MKTDRWSIKLIIITSAESVQRKYGLQKTDKITVSNEKTEVKTMSNKKKSKNYHTRMFVADTAVFMNEILKDPETVYPVEVTLCGKISKNSKNINDLIRGMQIARNPKELEKFIKNTMITNQHITRFSRLHDKTCLDLETGGVIEKRTADLAGKHLILKTEAREGKADIPAEKIPLLYQYLLNHELDGKEEAELFSFKKALDDAGALKAEATV